MIMIRRAEAGDARGIAHVHVESWRSTYAGIVSQTFLDNLNEWERTELWQATIARDDEVFVAERDGHVVGFAIGGPSRSRTEGCDAELYAIYLLKNAQRSRIGTDLLRELAASLVESGFKSMDVWVLEENPAKRFYQRMGAHYAAAKEIEIGGGIFVEHAYVWPNLKALGAVEAAADASKD